MHTDCGLIEYATPECGTLEELVVHELAGERLVWEAYGNGHTKANTIHKRCSTPTRGHSSGAHESYSTAVDLWTEIGVRDYNIDALAAHFATRTVFMGAGQPTDDGFALGQKMHSLEAQRGTDTTSKKTLVNLRDQPHAGELDQYVHGAKGPKLHRLHVTCGDANLSPWAIRMKFGTTSLVLRLLEHGKDISDLLLANPLQAAKIVAGNMDGMNIQLPLKSGKTKSALDIQETFVERAKKLSEEIELPAEEKAVIDDWFSIIHALRGDNLREDGKPGLEHIDWFTKYQLLEQDKERNIHKKRSHEEIRTRENRVELFFDQIPEGKGVKLRQHPHRFSFYAPSEDAINKATTTPPEGRARLRGTVIKNLVERNAMVGAVPDWDRLKQEGKQTHIFGPIDGNYDDAEIERQVENILKNVA